MGSKPTSDKKQGNKLKAFGTLVDEKIVSRFPHEPDSDLVQLNRSTFPFSVDTKKKVKAKIVESDPLEQVHIFNLPINRDGNEGLLDPYNTAASIKGSNEVPDVSMETELVAFHPNRHIAESSETSRATLRMDFGQDDLTSSKLRPLFWSIAAALDFQGLLESGKDVPRHYRNDFSEAFGNRPVSIGGGLCEFRFEVVAHKEPPWWKQVFSFLQTRTGKALTAAVGFPGVVDSAVSLLNEALNELIDDHETIFRSRPMTLALSEHAQNEFTMGNRNVIIGVLNPGYSLLIPKKDIATMQAANPYFLGTHGVMIPRDMSPTQFVQSEDPFTDISYAVLKTKARATKIDL